MQLRLVVRSCLIERLRLFPRLALVLIGASLPVRPMNAAGAGCSVYWTDSNGYWDVAANWTRSPTASDNVCNNRPGTVITHRQGNDVVKSLTMGARTALIMTGGSLLVTNGITLSSSSAFNLQDDTLGKATIEGSGLFAVKDSDLDGITIKTNVTDGRGGIVAINDGLVLIDREFLFSGGSRLIFDENQTLTDGNYRLSGNATFELSPARALIAVLNTLSLKLPSIYPIRSNRIMF